MFEECSICGNFGHEATYCYEHPNSEGQYRRYEQPTIEMEPVHGREGFSGRNVVLVAETAAEIERQRRAEIERQIRAERVRQRRAEINTSLSLVDIGMLVEEEHILDPSFLGWQIQIIRRMPEYIRHRFMYSEIVRNLNNEFTDHVTKEIKETPVKIDECSICYINITDSNVVELNCNHQFCGNCVNELFKLKCEPMCALCREPIKNVSSNQELITNL